jgi:hypothetical protein
MGICCIPSRDHLLVCGQYLITHVTPVMLVHAVYLMTARPIRVVTVRILVGTPVILNDACMVFLSPFQQIP